MEGVYLVARVGRRLPGGGGRGRMKPMAEL